MRARRAQRVAGASGTLSRMAIAVGDSAERTFQVTDEVLDPFGAATGDMNPMHFDDAFGATTMFGGRIAHGMLTAGFISAMIGMELPGPGAIYLGQTLQERLIQPHQPLTFLQILERDAKSQRCVRHHFAASSSFNPRRAM